MSILMRFVQQVRPADWEQYLAVERQFVDWERALGRVHGRRLRSLIGPEPVDTFVWEAEFPDRTAAMRALEDFELDTEHSDLWAQQVVYVIGRRVELLEVLDFAPEAQP